MREDLRALILQMDKLRLKKVIKAGLWAPKPMLPFLRQEPQTPLTMESYHWDGRPVLFLS